MRTTLYCIFFVQVDMKIMYYELIKMLIEYERNKQPEVKDKTRLKLEISKKKLISNLLIHIVSFFDIQVWDASKSVGKIEGYQVEALMFIFVFANFVVVVVGLVGGCKIVNL